MRASTLECGSGACGTAALNVAKPNVLVGYSQFILPHGGSSAGSAAALQGTQNLDSSGEDHRPI
jgi:hypothetical protein